MSKLWSPSLKSFTMLLPPKAKTCSQHCSSRATYSVCERRENKRKGGVEVGFGGQTLQPRSTHGILGGVSSPAFPLKLVGLAPAITLLFSGTCASSQELSECLSWNFSGSEVRSPSVVWPTASNYRACISIPFCGTSTAHIYIYPPGARVFIVFVSGAAGGQY